MSYRDKITVDDLTKRFGAKRTIVVTHGERDDAVEIYEELYELEQALLHLVVVTSGGKRCKDNDVLKAVKLAIRLPQNKVPVDAILETQPKD
jgi:hypothetical protein